MPATSATSSRPLLTKAGKPRKKVGRPPKAPHEKVWKEPKALVRPLVIHSKRRKQDVLLWLLNHRIQDPDDFYRNAARWKSATTPCVEKEPRKMPDGSEMWFRAPTLAEASQFWKVPLATVAKWWRDRDKLFEGVVIPESTIPLVHPTQRHRPKEPRQKAPPVPGLAPGIECWPVQPPPPDTEYLEPRPAGDPRPVAVAWPVAPPPSNTEDVEPRPVRKRRRPPAPVSWPVAPPPPNTEYVEPRPAGGPRLAAGPAYPSASQPSGPPMHPSAPHMQQTGPRLAGYSDASKPSGPPMHPLYRADFALHEVSKEVSCMIQNQHNVHLDNLLRAIALSQALVNDLTEAHKVLLDPPSYPQYYPSIAFSRPPPPPQQPTGPGFWTGDSHTFVYQGGSAQSHTLVWRMPLTGQQFRQPAKEAPAARESLSQRKRSYASKDGPGGTSELPIVLDDEVEAAAHERRNGQEKRRNASSIRDAEGTVEGDRPDTVDGSVDAISEAGAPDEDTAQDDNEVSSNRQIEPVANANSFQEDDSNATEQDAEPHDGLQDASGESHEHETDNGRTRQEDASSNADSDAEYATPEAGPIAKLTEIAASEDSTSSEVADETIVDEQTAASISNEETSADVSEEE